jgi:hypothetical protein
MFTNNFFCFLRNSRNFTITALSFVIISSFSIVGYVLVQANSVENTVEAQTEERCFSETGYCISGSIRDYWEQNGGLAVFGYPTTEQYRETVEGRTIQVQIFERDRLEIQNNGDITAGRLGALYYEMTGSSAQCDVINAEDWTEAIHVELDRDGNSIGGAARLDSSNVCDLIEVGKVDNNGIVTGELEPGKRYHNLCEPFLSNYKNNGGFRRFGFPITEKFAENVFSEDGGKYVQVQYFERRRMEHHTYLQGNPVLYGLLGKLIYDQEYGDSFSETNIRNAELDITGQSTCI